MWWLDCYQNVPDPDHIDEKDLILEETKKREARILFLKEQLETLPDDKKKLGLNTYTKRKRYVKELKELKEDL